MSWVEDVLDGLSITGRDHGTSFPDGAAGAFVVGALAEDRVGDVAEMKVGQLGDLGGDPRAAFALPAAGRPGAHEVVAIS